MWSRRPQLVLADRFPGVTMNPAELGSRQFEWGGIELVTQREAVETVVAVVTTSTALAL